MCIRDSQPYRPPEGDSIDLELLTPLEVMPVFRTRSLSPPAEWTAFSAVSPCSSARQVRSGGTSKHPAQLFTAVPVQLDNAAVAAPTPGDHSTFIVSWEPSVRPFTSDARCEGHHRHCPHCLP